MTSLSLQIDFTTTPISGTLQDDGGRHYEFVGWLGLSDRLRRIAEQTAQQGIPRAARQGGAGGSLTEQLRAG